MTELTWRDVEEQSRIYIFPTGNVRIDKVRRIAVSDTTHRVETTDGRKFIVPGGWLCIELVVDKWSF